MTNVGAIQPGLYDVFNFWFTRDFVEITYERNIYNVSSLISTLGGLVSFLLIIIKRIVTPYEKFSFYKEYERKLFWFDF